MPGVARAVATQRGGEAVLPAPRGAALAAAAFCALTALVFILVAVPATFAHIQHADKAFLRLMISIRTPPLTLAARFFNLLGLVYVTLPVRLALAGYLALKRRWWHLAAFAAAIVLSEILIGTLKSAYGRARPPGSLVATSGASFPSGHSVAAAVTVYAAVIALAPVARRQLAWGALAGVFASVMALSRAYLGAHWLSDAIAGLLLGASCALLAAVAVDQLRRSRENAGRHRRPHQRQARAPRTGSDRDDHASPDHRPRPGSPRAPAPAPGPARHRLRHPPQMGLTGEHAGSRRRRITRMAQILVAAAVIGLVFAYAIPQVADYS